MKKFTLFLMSLFLTVGAMAQTPINFADFDASKKYRIYNKAVDKGDNGWKAMSYNSSNGGCLKIYNETDASLEWRFVSAGENQYKLYNVQAQKYLGTVAGNKGVSMVAEASAAIYNVEAKTDGTQVRFWHTEATDERNYLWNDGNNNLYGWKEDSHEWWYLEEVKELPIYTVIYHYKQNGILVGSVSHEVLEGAEFPALVSGLYGVTVNGSKPTGTVQIDGEYDIAVTLGEMPFEYYASVADVNAANGWYNLVMHSNEDNDAAGRNRTYLGAGSSSNLAWGEDKTLTNAGNEYYWAFVGNPINGFRVVNKSADGKILSSNGTANPVLLQEEGLADGNNTTWAIAARRYSKTEDGDFVKEGNWFCLKHTKGKYMNANNANGNVGFWTDNDNGSAILAVKPLTINANADIATYFAETAISIPSTLGVEVYYADHVENTTCLKLAEVNSNIIYPGTGIIVKYETEDNITYAPEIVSPGTATAPENNLLKGSVKRTLVTKGENKAYYVLGIVDGVVGFYNAKKGENDNEFYNGAYKAYLEVPASQGSAAFYGFDWEGTTGVENVEVESAVNVIYDLTGRRVEAITAPGIYIVNGKKTLVK